MSCTSQTSERDLYRLLIGTIVETLEFHPEAQPGISEWGRLLHVSVVHLNRKTGQGHSLSCKLLPIKQLVNSHLVCDPTIRQPGFDLPRRRWSLLNRFRTEQGHCGACRRKWQLTDTYLCSCGETQTMSHIVESCPLTKLNGGLSRLHSADEDAVSWLTNYGK